MNLDPNTFKMYTNYGKVINNKDTLKSLGDVQMIEIRENKVAACCTLIWLYYYNSKEYCLK